MLPELPPPPFLHKLLPVDTVDFRSDTVTWPTDAMRQAMAWAPIGDDVYGEDPTVNALEARAAALLGKEAAVFVASGTMGNLCAVLAHADRGDEAILAADAHTYMSEAGGMAVLGGIVPRPLPTDEFGRMAEDAIEAAVRPDDPHEPRSRLILLENSFAAKNGAPLPPEYLAAVRRVADRHGLAMHIDGARLFNAAVALALEPRALAHHADSVSFCLSKGLCAPVGSVLCGSADFIYRARRARKVLGGGMRQVGIMAAAGLVALEEMIERLADDHANARALAVGLAEQPAFVLSPGRIKTNIVFFELADWVPLEAQEVVERLRRDFDVLLGTAGLRRFRAMTHYWIGPAEVELLLVGLSEIVEQVPTSRMT